uniref:Reverse transcriptase domain-containing protein n=1 Tax=Trichogramma kaykai TaxID=54128 RepID=A0ABD2WR42_9HYME
MCEEADRDTWGRPYEIVMSQLIGPKAKPPSSPSLVRRTVATLFPVVIEEPIPPPVDPDDEMAPGVSLEELRRASRKVKEHTAPGPDGVPNTALKIAVATRPDIFLRVFTACMRSGVFPRCWKRQRLVLLPKPDKPPDKPTSFRPICMLDAVGKMLERIICDRLQVFTESPSGLSDQQFGFRRGRSTIDAIERVVSTAREALRGRSWLGGTKEYCAVVTLDVKNAFNTVRWTNILTALERIETLAYLLKIIGNYFQDRVLEYSTSEGPAAGSVTAGVPQGSVLGPTLWNVMYDASSAV